MKKFLYIMVSIALLTGVAACEKQGVDINNEQQPQTRTLTLTPEYELGIDVKSAEIGTSDIWCMFWDADKWEWTGPFKQSEINGTTYSYQIPVTTNGYVFFAIMPEEMINNVYKSVSYYDPFIDINETFITTENPHIYMSSVNSYDDYGSYGIYVNSQSQSSISMNVKLMQRHRKGHLMLRFTNVPVGVEMKDVINNIFIKFENLTLDKGFKFSDMNVELSTGSDYSTTYDWHTADVYMYADSQRRNEEYYRHMSLIIERTDGQIYISDECSLNFYPSENIQFIIDYNYIVNTSEK